MNIFDRDMSLKANNQHIHYVSDIDRSTDEKKRKEKKI